MTAAIAVSPKKQFLDANGAPLVGGLLYTYDAGTTTPAASWTDQSQVALNTNPIVLDARGECLLWLDPAKLYRLALYDADASLVWSVDNVSGAVTAGELANTSNVALGDALVGVKQPVTGAVATTQHDFNARTLWAEDFGAVGDGSTDNTAAFNAAFAAAETLGGALIRVGRGTFVLEDAVYIQGDGTSLVGEAPGVTILSIRHGEAQALSAQKIDSPSILENIEIADLSIIYEQVPAEDPATTELIHCEAVRGLSIRNVHGEGGKALAVLNGCRRAEVEGNVWEAPAGIDAAVGILVDITTGGYVNPEPIYGSDIRIANNRIIAPYTMGDEAWILPLGIHVYAGVDVVVAENKIEGAELGIWVGKDDSTVALLRGITLQGNAISNFDEGVVLGGTGGFEIERIVVDANRITGEASTDSEWTTGIAAQGAGVEITYCQVINNLVTDVNGEYIDLACEILHLLVAGNQAVETQIGLGGNHIVIAEASIFAVTGNIVRNFSSNGSGIKLGAACANGSVVGNTVLGFLYGIELASGVDDVTVDANRIVTTGNPIRDLAASVSNLIQGRPVAFRAYRASSDQTFTDTNEVKAQLNAETFDPYGTFDASTNYRWTPGFAGIVQISGAVGVAYPAASGNAYAVIFKNGSEYARGAQSYNDASAVVLLPFSLVDECLSTDYYELFVKCDAVGTKSLLSGSALSYFSGVKIN